MRVLHLGKYYPPSYLGGLETVTFELAEGMTRLGFPSDVLCCNLGGPTVRESWKTGVGAPDATESPTQAEWARSAETAEAAREASATGAGRAAGVAHPTGTAAAADTAGTAGTPGWAAGAASYTVIRAAAPLVAASTPISPDYVRLVSRLAAGYDILHVHCPNPLAALALRLAGRRLNPETKMVLHWHSDVIRQKYFNKAYRITLGDWLARRCDAVVGATPAHVEDSEYARAFSGKSHIIPFCLDPEPFSADRVDQAALAGLKARFAGKKAVFALGRLISYKGFDVLVQAAGSLPEDWVALIGGTGPLEGELRRLIERLGLADRVVLLSRVPQEELSAHYRFCRVFCLPSVTRAEMYGMVQLEAMACGRPVVSTRIPGSGVPWVNEHGVTGLTVPPRDPEALARAMLEIDRDEARYEAMSQAGLRASRERFAPRVMLDGMRKLYEGLVGARRTPR